MSIVNNVLDIVNEASWDRYMQMYPDKLIDKDFHTEAFTEFENSVEFAINTFKKENWIVWYLRWRRLAIILSYGIPGAWKKAVEQYSKASHLPINLIEDDVAKKFGPTKEGNYDTIKYKHIASLFQHIPELNEYDPEWRARDIVIGDVNDIEGEWKAKTRRFVSDRDVSEKVEVILDFGNGFQWFNLNEDGCRAEANAMGHYSTGGHHGDINLSLRHRGKVGGVDGWIPELTFIWNEISGFLGEMKGPENSKPKPEFYRYIVKLLELDMIKGICLIPSGGYRLEYNFKFMDLSISDRLRLFESKPLLAPPDYVLENGGINENTISVVNTLIKEMRGPFELSMLPPDNYYAKSHLSVERYATVKDFFDDFGILKVKGHARWAYNYIQDNDDDSYYSFRASKYDVKDFLTDVMSTYSDIKEKLIGLLKRVVEGSEELGAYYIDYDDDSDVAHAYANYLEHEDLGQEIKDAVTYSMIEGIRSGTEERVYKAFVRWLDNLDIGVLTLVLDDDEGYILERGCTIIVSAKDLTGELLTEEFLQENDDWNSVVNHFSDSIDDMSDDDYQGYSEKDAFEDFKYNRIEEILDRYPEEVQ